MLRYEGSIRELFQRSCTADRSFVPKDDSNMDMLWVVTSPGQELFPFYIPHLGR
jgi:hypothetical protein